jgi:hypothetical protein
MPLGESRKSQRTTGQFRTYFRNGAIWINLLKLCNSPQALVRAYRRFAFSISRSASGVTFRWVADRER